MPTIFKHPDVEDYFVASEGLQPITDIYEQAKVVTTSGVKFDIDHDFWGDLPVDGYPALKKLKSVVSLDDYDNDPRLEGGLNAAGLPPDLRQKLRDAIREVYEKVLPAYQALFDGYRVIEPRVTWRLDRCVNENTHFDIGANTDHFARLFINLDNQPRIWTTSHTLEQIHALYPDKVNSDDHQAFRKQANTAAFGSAQNWWTSQPKHTVYFDPGDMWAVESRLVSHQIFYGRRAVTLDFMVDKTSMKNPDRHFAAVIDRLCREGRAGAGRVEELA